MIMCFHYSEAFSAVRLTRWTLWTLVVMLFVQSSGAVSLLHKLTHHPGFGGDQAAEAVLVLCHAAGDGAELPDDQPRPEPSDDEDCSICLGLAGLHLIPAPEPVRVVDAPGFTEQSRVASRVVALRTELSDAPARAPPVC